MSKEIYRYEYQLTAIMIDNYGITLDEFVRLVREKYDAVPYYDIIATHERVSAKKLYRVVETDNFNGDYPNEHFIGMIDSEGISHPFTFDTKEQAHTIASAFNSLNPSSTAPRFYKEVEKNYILSGGFEP